MPGELIGHAVPGVGIGGRFSLGDDVWPEICELVIEFEPVRRSLDIGIREDGLGGALRLAHAAVDALVRLYDEHVLAVIEAVGGTVLDAVRVFAFDAVVGDDVGHHPAFRSRSSRC